jgi:hypothetical protein
MHACTTKDEHWEASSWRQRTDLGLNRGGKRRRYVQPTQENREQVGRPEGLGSGSTSGVCQTPITMTPMRKTNDKHKAAERAAGKPAAPNVHDVYHRFLMGPSDRELTGTTAQGLLWVERSEQRATWHYVDGVVEQQEVGYEVEERFLLNPKMIQQGAQGPSRSFKFVGGLGMRGCLRAQVSTLPQCRFRNWEDFKKHCKYMEVHLFIIL